MNASNADNSPRDLPNPSNTPATHAAKSATPAASVANKSLISVPTQHGLVTSALYQMQKEAQLCDVHFVIHTKLNSSSGSGNSNDSASDDGWLDCGSRDCDAVISVDQNTIRIPAHRVVLAASSSYFRALFTSAAGGFTSEVDVPGIRYLQACRMFIEFLYTGKIANPSPSEDPTEASLSDLADRILGVLELAVIYAVDALRTACIAYLRPRITVTNCLHWLHFTKRLENCADLYQSCFAFFCSFLKDFPVGTTDALDVDLFISIISSDCLNVSGEMHVLDLVGQWLIADGSRIELHGARVLSFVRFALLPRPDIEQWAARLSTTALDIQTAVNSALVVQQLQQLALNEDPNATGTQKSSVSATSSTPSGWDSLSRIYSMPLYDRQKATVLKQTKDAGFVRAIVLAPNNSLFFSGSATTHSSEVVTPINPVASAAGVAPQPYLKVWNTTSWICEQSIPCEDDIVSMVVQEYPTEVYANLLECYQSAIQEATASTRSNEPPVKLPSYQLVSAQLFRSSKLHPPRLNVRIWEFQPTVLMMSLQVSDVDYAASAGGRWHCTKEFALSPAFVKNPVLFVVDSQRLLVGNHRTIQIWNTSNSVMMEQELKLDCTMRSFVLCSCGHELLGRSVLGIRAWDTRTWIATRTMAAKLGGDHRAKLASCLTLYQDRLIFPMRDCIIVCDPHSGAHLQKFSFPPDPTIAPFSKPSVITVCPASGGSLMSTAALSNADAWLPSSFVLAGDRLVIATYQGWLGVFRIQNSLPVPVSKKNDAADSDPLLDINALVARAVSTLVGNRVNSSDMMLHCERFWQTAGAGIDKGAVVNSLAVIMTSNASLPPSAAIHEPSRDNEPCTDDASMTVPEIGVNHSKSQDANVQADAVISSVVTVVDYGNMMALWRKC